MPFRSDRPCPACGNVIEFDPIDITAWGNTTPRFTAGRARCRSECDPRFRRVVIGNDRQSFDRFCRDMHWDPRRVIYVDGQDNMGLVGYSVPEFMVTVIGHVSSPVARQLAIAIRSAEHHSRERPFPPVPEPRWVDEPEEDTGVNRTWTNESVSAIMGDLMTNAGMPPWVEDGQMTEAEVTAWGDQWVRVERFPRMRTREPDLAMHYEEQRARAHARGRDALEAEQRSVMRFRVDPSGFVASMDAAEEAIRSAEAEFRRPSAPEYGGLILDHGQDAMRSNPETEEATFRL